MSAYPIVRWDVGDVTITKVVESEMRWPWSALLPDVTPEHHAADWLGPFVHPDGRIRMSFHTLVVESGGRTVMVDTCVGNDKERVPHIFHLQSSPFLADLAEAGYDPADIDAVFCTHLHVDHVGWNTSLVDGAWVPTFPNARYLFARDEFEFWQRGEADLGVGDVWGDSMQPIVDAGLHELIDPGHRLTDEVWLEPTPGHTPGHCSVRISSGGAEAIITGDMTHHPVQFAHPDICSSADIDPDAAAATRRQAYARWQDDVLVIGTHFVAPTAGVLTAADGAWRFDPQPT